MNLINCSYTQSITYSWIDNPYSLGSYSGYSTTLSTALDAKIVHEGRESQRRHYTKKRGQYTSG